jgi:chromosome segregation ATPase
MSKIEERVIERIRERAQAGLQKYGTTMEREDLTVHRWLRLAQEEALDLAVYLERLQEECGKLADARDRALARTVALADELDAARAALRETRARTVEMADELAEARAALTEVAGLVRQIPSVTGRQLEHWYLGHISAIRAAEGEES